MTHHEPAGCEIEGCGRCDDYGLGYSAGKSKMLFEIGATVTGGHPADCTCSTCGQLRGEIARQRADMFADAISELAGV